MIHLGPTLTPKSLQPAARRVFEAAAPKIKGLQKRWRESDGKIGRAHV